MDFFSSLDLYLSCGCRLGLASICGIIGSGEYVCFT